MARSVKMARVAERARRAKMAKVVEKTKLARVDEFTN